MLRFRNYSTLLLLALCVSSQSSIAKPEITINTRYFSVAGHDSASIRQSIQRSGPTGTNGTTYHAHTRKDIQWDYRWIESSSFCRINRINVSIEVEYLLPQLQNPEALDSLLLDRWNDYSQALFKHEQRHKDFGIQAAHELENELLSIQQMPCPQLHHMVSKKADTILKKYDDLDLEYDRKTRHGINEGIVLP